jgi:hypothetical protein
VYINGFDTTAVISSPVSGRLYAMVLLLITITRLWSSMLPSAGWIGWYRRGSFSTRAVTQLQAVRVHSEWMAPAKAVPWILILLHFVLMRIDDELLAVDGGANIKPTWCVHSSIKHPHSACYVAFTSELAPGSVNFQEEAVVFLELWSSGGCNDKGMV